ncbi:MAG: hypothetical protein ABEJ74_05120 [Haloferacaceae archaeon]
MNSHANATERRLLLSGREWSVVGGATGLVVLNVLVMFGLSATPLASVTRYLFAVPIVGALVFGAVIVGGEQLAERGVEDGNLGFAVAGMALLQLAFGVLGAGALARLAPATRVTALVLTAVVTAVLTAVIATYVYARSSTTFEHYGTWANYAFLGGLVAILVGTFVAPVLLAGFVLIFLGFLLRLGWEIWRVRDGRGASATMQAIGLYIAVAGVFVHVLRLVVQMLRRR